MPKSSLAPLNLLIVAAVAFGQPASAAPPRDRAQYRKRTLDPVIEQLRKQDKADKKRRGKQTSKIKKTARDAKEKRRKNRRRLRLDFKGIEVPSSPAAFKRVYHHPPVAQYLTGTCWAYSATSFLESEVFRLTKRKIKLSEQHTVYYEYLEKVRRWLRKRGHSELSQGSENNAVVRIFQRYGAVPQASYAGVTRRDRRHNHSLMTKRIKAYLKHCKAAGLWDERVVLTHVRSLLDKHLGAPPVAFAFEGQTYSPRRFVREVLKLDLGAYVEIMSTKKIPFWTTGLFDVPDNWWRSRDYHNLPLPVFYKLIKDSITRGYSVAIGGDVSEPGRDGHRDAAVIPSYDIPQQYIDQDSREYRIDAKVTTDDHGMHLVGYTKHGGRDWFLIKDSGRSARWGKAKGYYYFRDDFIRLKMLSATVHKDLLGSLKRRFRRSRR